MSTADVAFRDLGGSLQQLPLAIRLALDDVHGKYRRTILGPLWIAFGQAATIAGFVVVFSVLLGETDPLTYALYLAAGIPVWALLSQFLMDMPQAFIASRGLIESFELPWLTHIWRRSVAYVLLFLHHLVTLFVAMMLMKVTPSINMLFAFPALLIVLVAGTGVGMMFAVIGARYRDLQPAMQVASGFLFLFTPVMWRPEQLIGNEWAYQFNPLYYFVAVLREPLLGQAPSLDLWIGTAAGAAALFMLGFLTFLLARRRLYHWL